MQHIENQQKARRYHNERIQERQEGKWMQQQTQKKMDSNERMQEEEEEQGEETHYAMKNNQQYQNRQQEVENKRRYMQQQPLQSQQQPLQQQQPPPPPPPPRQFQNYNYQQQQIPSTTTTTTRINNHRQQQRGGWIEQGTIPPRSNEHTQQVMRETQIQYEQQHAQGTTRTAQEHTRFLEARRDHQQRRGQTTGITSGGAMSKVESLEEANFTQFSTLAHSLANYWEASQERLNESYRYGKQDAVGSIEKYLFDHMDQQGNVNAARLLQYIRQQIDPATLSKPPRSAVRGCPPTFQQQPNAFSKKKRRR